MKTRAGPSVCQDSVEEAARENAYLRQIYMNLQKRESYESVGLSSPPKCVMSPSLEEVARSMRIVGITSM